MHDYCVPLRAILLLQSNPSNTVFKYNEIELQNNALRNTITERPDSRRGDFLLYLDFIIAIITNFSQLILNIAIMGFIV